MSTSKMWRGLAAAAAGALTAGTLAIAVPAQAATTTNTIQGQYNGLVGVAQAVTIQVPLGGPCGSVLAPAVTLFASSQSSGIQNQGAATLSSCTGSLAAYTINWVPASATTWTLTATDDQNLSTTSNPPIVTIGKVPVNVTIASPDTVQIGTTATITATVAPVQGIYAPIGNVQFRVNGQNVGSPVFLGGGTPSTASYQWTPTTGGTFNWTAVYTPGPDRFGVIDASCNANCTSPNDPSVVSSGTSRMYLANPPQFYAGTANNITAVVTAIPSAGTVTFQANGSTIAANVPVQSNGQATTSWTPPIAGSYLIQANWTSSTGVTASSQETINVAGSAPSQDAIVVTANGQNWVPGTYPVLNGTSVTFAATTSSGAATQLSEAGPCLVSGTTVTAPLGSGQCRISISSPGGNGFGANTVQYVLNLAPGQQVATLAAPASGRVNKGKTLTLESPDQSDTNAGQNITWKVTSGKSICKLSFPASGAVKLKVVGRGSCTVKGTAPAVPGQWQKFVASRTYRAV